MDGGGSGGLGIRHEPEMCRVCTCLEVTCACVLLVSSYPRPGHRLAPRPQRQAGRLQQPAGRPPAGRISGEGHSCMQTRPLRTRPAS